MTQNEQWLTRAEIAAKCGVSIPKVSEIVNTHHLPERTLAKDRRRRLFNFADVKKHLEAMEDKVRV
jgi:hypothetical protein